MADINVTVGGVTQTFPEGVSIESVAREMAPNGQEPLLAKVNGSLKELFKRLYSDCDIEFLDITTGPGYKTYERGLIFLMLAALYRLYGQDECNNLRVEHSIGQGIYCEINGRLRISEEFLGTLRKEMLDICKEDRMIEKKSMNTGNAIKLFEKAGMEDKVKLLSYRMDSKTNVYMLCGFRALRKMPVSVYGILDMARVVFSALLGILILGERPSLMQAGGIVLVCLGLFLLRFVKEDEPTKAEEGKPAEVDVSEEKTAEDAVGTASAEQKPEAPAKHKPGFYVALAMVSCFLNAVSGNMDKILMKDDRMSSGQLQLWYMFFLVAFYVIYTLARRIHLNFRGMLKNPWIWGLSILFVIADRALFIANGYAESRVIVMTVLKQACTIVTILGGWLVFREKKILRKLLCAAVVIAGIVLSVC